MKPLSVVTTFVRCMAVATWSEARLGSAMIAKSFESDVDSALREHLATAVLLLVKHHDDLLSRVREQFGPRKPLEAPAVDEAFDASETLPLADGIAALRASVEARTRLCAEEALRFDGHTRLLFQVQRSATEAVVVRSCAVAEEIARGAAPKADGERPFHALYAAYLPDLVHADDFRMVTK